MFQMTWPKAFSSYRPRSQRIYGAICQHDSKYLLVQGRRTGRWSWPKGHIHRDEHVQDCVKREVYEETGIKDLPATNKTIKLKVGEYFMYEFSDKSPDLKPIDTNEIMDIGWFSLDEIRRNSDKCNIDVNYFIKREVAAST